MTMKSASPSRTLAIVLLGLLLAVTAPHAHAEDAFAALDAQADKLAKRARGGGFALALVDGDHLRWARGYGQAAASPERAFTADTPLPVGELSTLHLGALALRLQRQGRLDLDAPVSRHLPALRIDARGLADRAPSLREILSGHSGLVRQQLRGAFYRDGPLPDAKVDPLRDLYALQAPGRLYGASPLAIELAACALEAAGGAPIDVLLAREVTGPLELPALGADTDAANAELVRKDRSRLRLHARERIALGRSASARQLAGLLAALLGDAHEDWLPRDARRALFADQAGARAPRLDLQAGFGVLSARDPRPGVGRVAFLDSGFPVAYARALVAPEHGVAVIAVANHEKFYDGDDGLSRLQGEALDTLLREKLPTLAERPEKRPLPPTLAMPDGMTRDDWAERYSTLFGLLEGERGEDRFDAATAGWHFRLDPRDDGWWRVRLDLFRTLPLGFDMLDRIALRPARYGDRRVLLLATPIGTVFAGSAQAQGSGARAASLAGRYRLLNADELAEELEVGTVDLVDAGGLLRVRLKLPGFGPFSVKPEIPLVPEHAAAGEVAGAAEGDVPAGEYFRVPGFAPGLGERLRFYTENGRQRFAFSGYVLERVAD